MAVREGIENSFAVSSEFYQLHLLQDAELVGDGTLSHAKGIRNVAYTQFFHGKSVQDADPGGIPESFKKLSQGSDDFLRRNDLSRICQMMVVFAAQLDMIVFFHKNLLQNVIN